MGRRALLNLIEEAEKHTKERPEGLKVLRGKRWIDDIDLQERGKDPDYVWAFLKDVREYGERLELICYFRDTQLMKRSEVYVMRREDGKDIPFLVGWVYDTVKIDRFLNLLIYLPQIWPVKLDHYSRPSAKQSDVTAGEITANPKRKEGVVTMTTVDMAKKYYSPAEVQAMYGISQKTLANWRCQGKGPRYLKRGGIIRYSLQELERWEEANTIRTVGFSCM